MGVGTAPPMDSSSEETVVMGLNARANSRTNTAKTISMPVAMAKLTFANGWLKMSASPVLIG
jgi:hypothetical protein